jgi:hypothetical protein
MNDWYQGQYPDLVSNLFYFGLNPRWDMYKFLPQGINVMYSSAGFWDDDAREWRRKRFKRSFGLKFLDSGGYLMLLRYGYYPFSVVNYANLVARLKPDFYATMDYACEPDLVDTSKVRLRTVEARIRATVDNAEGLAEWESHLSGRMVPVIQGYTLAQYESCINLYNERGLIRDYMAVGSMCQRRNNDDLDCIIPAVYRVAQDAGVKRLHFFGLKLSSDLRHLDKYIYSRDSAIAMSSYDKGTREARGGTRWPRGQTEKKAAFFAYLDRLKKLDLQVAMGEM